MTITNEMIWDKLCEIESQLPNKKSPAWVGRKWFMENEDDPTGNIWKRLTTEYPEWFRSKGAGTKRPTYELNYKKYKA